MCLCIWTRAGFTLGHGTLVKELPHSYVFIFYLTLLIREANTGPHSPTNQNRVSFLKAPLLFLGALLVLRAASAAPVPLGGRQLLLGAGSGEPPARRASPARHTERTYLVMVYFPRRALGILGGRRLQRPRARAPPRDYHPESVPQCTTFVPNIRNGSPSFNSSVLFYSPLLVLGTTTCPRRSAEATPREKGQFARAWWRCCCAAPLPQQQRRCALRCALHCGALRCVVRCALRCALRCAFRCAFRCSLPD